jgi:hypothetical protein
LVQENIAQISLALAAEGATLRLGAIGIPAGLGVAEVSWGRFLLKA